MRVATLLLAVLFAQLTPNIASAQFEKSDCYDEIGWILQQLNFKLRGDVSETYDFEYGRELAADLLQFEKVTSSLRKEISLLDGNTSKEAKESVKSFQRELAAYSVAEREAFNNWKIIEKKYCQANSEVCRERVFATGRAVTVDPGYFLSHTRSDVYKSKENSKSAKIFYKLRSQPQLHIAKDPENKMEYSISLNGNCQATSVLVNGAIVSQFCGKGDEKYNAVCGFTGYKQAPGQQQEFRDDGAH